MCRLVSNTLAFRLQITEYVDTGIEVEGVGVHVDGCSNIKIVLNLETFRFLRAPWNTQIGLLYKGNHRMIYKKMQTFQCALLFIFFLF